MKKRRVMGWDSQKKELIMRPEPEPKPIVMDREALYEVYGSGPVSGQFEAWLAAHGIEIDPKAAEHGFIRLTSAQGIYPEWTIEGDVDGQVGVGYIKPAQGEG